MRLVQFSFRSLLVCTVISSVLFQCFELRAMGKEETQGGAWNEFTSQLDEQSQQRKTLGSSYIASGLLVAIGGIVGQQRSQDAPSRLVYGFSQGLGAFAFGYGLTQILVGEPNDSFHHALKSSNLSLSQRNQLTEVFLKQELERRELESRLNMITHSIVAGFNFYAARNETDSNTKSILVGLGVLNLIVGVTIPLL